MRACCSATALSGALGPRISSRKDALRGAGAESGAPRPEEGGRGGGGGPPAAAPVVPDAGKGAGGGAGGAGAEPTTGGGGGGMFIFGLLGSST